MSQIEGESLAGSGPSLMSGAACTLREERSSCTSRVGARRRLPSLRGLTRRLAGLALFACLCAVSAVPVRALEPGAPTRTVVVAAKLEQTPDGTRLVFVASQPLTATPFALEKPDRLVLDLPEVNFQLPAHTGETGAGLVKSFRYGLFGFGR